MREERNAVGFRESLEGSAAQHCTVAKKAEVSRQRAVQNGLMREMLCWEKTLRDQRKVLLTEVGCFCRFWKLCVQVCALDCVAGKTRMERLFFFFFLPAVLFSFTPLPLSLGPIFPSCFVTECCLSVSLEGWHKKCDVHTRQGNL